MAKTDTFDDLLVEMASYGLLKSVLRLSLRESSEGLAINELTDELRVKCSFDNFECLDNIRMLHAR
jgi:hypothetical protein